VITVIGVSAGVALAATSGGTTAGSLAARARPLSTAAGTRQAAATVPSSVPSAVPRAVPSAAATARPAASTTPTPAASTTPASARAVTRTVQQPYLINDSATPETIPAGEIVATYADGPHPTPLAEVAGRARVLWIDIEGTDTAAAAIDVEPGCATPSAAASWVQAKLSADPGAKAIIYTMISEWPTVQADVAALPAWMHRHVRWWIADPTGRPHVVPGSQATQWYWGPSYDISTALPDF
jgi:hypothetical protein